MGKLRRNETGFGAIEVLLALIFVAIVAFHRDLCRTQPQQ
jgi:type II secretory pathway component PulJ